MKIAVITSICGNKESLSNPTVVHSDVDYYAFVDIKNPKATVWKQLSPYHFSNDKKYSNRRNAKIFKVLPELFIHDYDYYFWVDASHDLIASPQDIAKKYTSDDQPFAVFQHLQRNCIYKEALILKKLRYDYKDLITKEMKYFKSYGYPKENGLYELSAFVKKRTHQSTLASLKWWEYLSRYSSRDQISFPFVLWECKIKPTIMPGFANGFNAKGEIGNNEIMPQTRKHTPSGV